MERRLTEDERSVIMEMCKSRIFLTKYMNLTKIIAPLFTMFIFVQIYRGNKGFFWLLIIGVLLSIIEFVAMSDIQKEMKSIINNTATCSENVVLNKIIKTSKMVEGDKRQLKYILTYHNDQKIKVSYEGNDFLNLYISDKILLINCGKNIFRKNIYICFSIDSINR